MTNSKGHMFSCLKNCLGLLILSTITFNTLPVSLVDDAHKGLIVGFFYFWLLKATVWSLNQLFTAVLPALLKVTLFVCIVFLPFDFAEKHWAIISRFRAWVPQQRAFKFFFGSTVRQYVTGGLALSIVGLLILSATHTNARADNAELLKSLRNLPAATKTNQQPPIDIQKALSELKKQFADYVGF